MNVYVFELVVTLCYSAAVATEMTVHRRWRDSKYVIELVVSTVVLFLVLVMLDWTGILDMIVRNSLPTRLNRIGDVTLFLTNGEKIFIPYRP